jgi:hypothetical protein
MIILLLLISSHKSNRNSIFDLSSFGIHFEITSVKLSRKLIKVQRIQWNKQS